MKLSTSLFLCAASLVTSACSIIPPSAYSDRGTPESLLDVSSEIVTIELLSVTSIDELQEWVESDQPSRAELYCVEGDVLCDSAEQTLSLYNVEYEWIPAQISEINLVYERVIAHDCENRFIDNRINPYNLNHPTYGCSVASNMVQMVSDRSQFVNPSLKGFYDGRSAAKGMQRMRDFDAVEYFDDSKDNSLIGNINLQ